MKIRYSDTREHRKTMQLAREYRRKGYQVTCDELLTDKRLRVDLVARRGDETIVIEVKSSESLHAQKTAVAQVAAYVATLPDARFDLVLTNPKKKSDGKTYSKVT